MLGSLYFLPVLSSSRSLVALHLVKPRDTQTLESLRKKFPRLRELSPQQRQSETGITQPKKGIFVVLYAMLSVCRQYVPPGNYEGGSRAYLKNVRNCVHTEIRKLSIKVQLSTGSPELDARSHNGEEPRGRVGGDRGRRAVAFPCCIQARFPFIFNYSPINQPPNWGDCSTFQWRNHAFILLTVATPADILECVPDLSSV